MTMNIEGLDLSVEKLAREELDYESEGKPSCLSDTFEFLSSIYDRL